MKKLTATLFIIIAIVIGYLIFRENFDFSKNKNNENTPNVFTQSQETELASVDSAFGSEDNTIHVVVPLYANEKVIESVSIDYNDDYYVDQIVAVEKTTTPYIGIIIGLYNTQFGAFERSFELETDIQQNESFSLDILDITGTHQQAIVVSGYTPSNEAALQVWLSSIDGFNLDFSLIADIRSDGSIEVHHIVRSSSYAVTNQAGESFPIWSYTSVPDAAANSLDQMQIVYDWSEKEQKYIEKSKVRIYGKNINAQALAKIQDGTEKSFGSFLNATWIKTTPSTVTPINVFFDYPLRTITFLDENVAETYMWDTSVLKKNGILIYASNANIPSLGRRINVSLVSEKEIRVTSTDTLTMIASQKTTWDGIYQRQEIDSLAQNDTAKRLMDEEETLHAFEDAISDTSWTSYTGLAIDFSDVDYRVTSGPIAEEGNFALFTAYDTPLIQFYCTSDTNVLEPFYEIDVLEWDELGMQLVLRPVTVGATALVPSIDPEIILEVVTPPTSD